MAKTRIDIKNITFTNLAFTKLSYDPVNICPCCKYAISPINISHLVYDKGNSTYVSLFEFCNNCHSAIINTYVVPDAGINNLCDGSLISSEPAKFVQKTFDQSINKLSPQFIKIYNQALAAETSGLDEIAGLGYRKSLEFLIKDFAIKRNPDDSEKIKVLQLSPCINTYIDSPNIKTLAIKSTWIGNDEAHYIRKQENRDINDMKRFISATVYFISMILITEDAESMEPAK